MKQFFLHILFAALLIVSVQAKAAEEAAVSTDETQTVGASEKVSEKTKAEDAKEDASDAAPKAEEEKKPVAEAPKEESKPVPPPSQKQAKDNCGGAENYLGLRVYGKGETPLAGSNKIDVSKLPMGTRVFMPNDEKPAAMGTGKGSDPKRLNLIIDHRNVISEAFCG